MRLVGVGVRHGRRRGRGARAAAHVEHGPIAGIINCHQQLAVVVSNMIIISIVNMNTAHIEHGPVVIVIIILVVTSKVSSMINIHSIISMASIVVVYTFGLFRAIASLGPK